MSVGIVRAVLAAAVLTTIGSAAVRDAAADGCGPRGHDCGRPGYGRGGCRNVGPYAARYGRSHTYYPAWWGARPCGTRAGYGCDALAERLGAPCARGCGYRFHVGPRWASLVYDRRAYAWPSFVQADDAGDDDETAEVAAPAVPLGPRAEAHEALFAGDAATAEAKFRALATADPTDAAAWIGVAHACFGRADYSGAAAALDRAAALGAISPAQRLDVPATFADPDDFRRRVDAVRVRTRFNAMDSSARTVLAWVEAGTGESSESVAEAKYVLRDHPAAPCARVLAGLPPEPPVAAEPAAPAPVTEAATK